MLPEKKERLEGIFNEKRPGKSKASLKIYRKRPDFLLEIYLFEFCVSKISIDFRQPLVKPQIGDIYAYTIRTRSPKLHNPNTHAQPQAMIRFTCLGFSSTLRTSSPCIEPGDLPLLMEAMSSTDSFYA